MASVALCSCPYSHRAQTHQWCAARQGAVAAVRVADGRRGSKEILVRKPSCEDLLGTLVHLAKLRWRVERDYEELKQEIGLGHFEGRTWRGFHHRAILCATADAFLGGC